ncbi:MAG: S41 family peptidase [Alistipes sp.]|nr:S41 family peptidase [Alistipes sp.]
MERKKKIVLWSVLIITLLIVSMLWLGVVVGRSYERNAAQETILRLSEFIERSRADIEKFNSDVATLESYVSGNDKLMQTISHVRNHYVDPISLDTIYEKAIPALLSELDPHSEYIPAKLFDRVNENLEGEFDGIGIVFNAMTDTITVLSVIPQGPSDKAGVRAGDRIVRIDGRNVAGQKLSQDSMMRLMRGKRGTHVKLSIERMGHGRAVEVDVTRAAIELHSIETAFIIDKRSGIGYVRLSQFARTTYKELRESLAKLREEGMSSLILDLRGNSGGFLDQAILLANEFLDDEKLIVYTVDRSGKKQLQCSNGKGGSKELPLAILVDETSASSSEILAGAIQDNDRGLIIGRRTFGKGLVQTQIPFSDGSAIRLTIARYFTPTGRSIQKPYTSGDEMSYHLDIVNRYNHHELFSADSIRFDDSMKFTTPKGRTVYGGGGIMPDIFIPLDTLGQSKYYKEVWNDNTLYRYTIEFTDRHRAAMERIASLEELDSFLADKNLVEDFVAYAERHGIKRDSEGLATSRHIIEAQLRAYIGRNTMDNESGFYYNIYPIDNTLRRAVEELKKKK